MNSSMPLDNKAELSEIHTIRFAHLQVHWISAIQCRVSIVEQGQGGVGDGCRALEMFPLWVFS